MWELFVLLVLALFVAMCLNNMLKALRWRLGGRPRDYDPKTANLAAKEAARRFADFVSKAYRMAGKAWTAEDDASCYADCYEFAKAAILAYYWRLEIPTFDTTPDPKGGLYRAEPTTAA